MVSHFHTFTKHQEKIPKKKMDKHSYTKNLPIGFGHFFYMIHMRLKRNTREGGNEHT